MHFHSFEQPSATRKTYLLSRRRKLENRSGHAIRKIFRSRKDSAHSLSLHVSDIRDRERERERERERALPFRPFRLYSLLKCILAHIYLYLHLRFFYTSVSILLSSLGILYVTDIDRTSILIACSSRRSKKDVARRTIIDDAGEFIRNLSESVSRRWKRTDHKKRRGSRLYLVTMRAGDLAAINYQKIGNYFAHTWATLDRITLGSFH